MKRADRENDKNQKQKDRSTPTAMSEPDGVGESASFCSHIKFRRFIAMLLFGEKGAEKDANQQE
jgi:hypothetical protein